VGASSGHLPYAPAGGSVKSLLRNEAVLLTARWGMWAEIWRIMNSPEFQELWSYIYAFTSFVLLPLGLAMYFYQEWRRDREKNHPHDHASPYSSPDIGSKE